MRKRKFLADLLNTAREFQLQAQAASKRRKLKNDHVQVLNQSWNWFLFEELLRSIVTTVASIASEINGT